MAIVTGKKKQFAVIDENDFNVSAKAAKQLAVRYAAFLDAARTGDMAGAKLWGELLWEMQMVTGIDLISLATIRDYSPNFTPLGGN